MKRVNFCASRMSLWSLTVVHEIRSHLSLPTAFLLPGCPALPVRWLTHDTPGFKAFYVTPGFTACIPFLGTGSLRAAVPVPGSTQVGWAPRQHSLSDQVLENREDKLSIQYPCRWPPMWLVKGNMLLLTNMFRGCVLCWKSLLRNYSFHCMRICATAAFVHWSWFSLKSSASPSFRKCLIVEGVPQISPFFISQD